MFTVVNSKEAVIELGRKMGNINCIEPLLSFYKRNTVTGLDIPREICISDGCVYKEYLKVENSVYSKVVDKIINSLTNDFKLKSKLKRRALSICEYVMSGVMEFCKLNSISELECSFNRISFTRFVGNSIIKNIGKTWDEHVFIYNKMVDDMSYEDFIVFSCILLEDRFDSQRFSEKIVLDSLSQLYLRIPSQIIKKSSLKYESFIVNSNDQLLKLKLGKVIGLRLMSMIKDVNVEKSISDFATTGYLNSIRLIKFFSEEFGGVPSGEVKAC